jgi:hypothetical protein
MPGVGRVHVELERQGLVGVLTALSSPPRIVTVDHPSFSCDDLDDLAEALDACEAAMLISEPGPPRVTFESLLIAPRPLGHITIHAGRWPGHDRLAALAALRDPVADRNAGWLLACVAAATGTVLRAADTGRQPVQHRLRKHHDDADALTAEGRAWLIQRAMECCDADAITPSIVRALTGTARP